MDINELAAALAKAQGQIDPAPKDANNPFFKTKYASLPAVREAMRHAFAANGLSVVQMPEVVEGQLRLRTILLHASGQSLDCGSLIADVDLTNPQKIGSAITYFRRYALAAISQTVADDDDDANAASQPGKQKPKSKPTEPPLTEEEVSELNTCITGCNDLVALQESILKGKQYQRLKSSGPPEAYEKTAKLAKAKHAILSTEREHNADGTT